MLADFLMTETGPCFRALPQICHRFGEQVAVYNIASGDTHLLDRRTAEALEQLAEKPLSAAVLEERLAQAWARPVPEGRGEEGRDAGDLQAEDLAAWTAEVLARFEALALVERAPGGADGEGA